MKKQIKETVNPLVFVEKTLEEISTCDASLKMINNRMDQQMLEIRRNNMDQITSLQQQKEEASNRLQAFAIENQGVLFSVKRSFATKFGSFGFRTGKPKFKLLNDASWDHVTESLKNFLPHYVRTVEEPMKEKLMADRNLPEISNYLPALNLAVVQDETFFIDLKKEK